LKADCASLAERDILYAFCVYGLWFCSAELTATCNVSGLSLVKHARTHARTHTHTHTRRCTHFELNILCVSYRLDNNPIQAARNRVIFTKIFINPRRAKLAIRLSLFLSSSRRDDVEWRRLATTKTTTEQQRIQLPQMNRTTK